MRIDTSLMTRAEFDRELSQLMEIPEVWEVLRRVFEDEVKNAWAKKNPEKAYKHRIDRGWDIFDSNRGFEIQRDDEMGIFDDDEDALNYICHNEDQARMCIEELLELLNEGRTSTERTQR